MSAVDPLPPSHLELTAAAVRRVMEVRCPECHARRGTQCDILGPHQLSAHLIERVHEDRLLAALLADPSEAQRRLANAAAIHRAGRNR